MKLLFLVTGVGYGDSTREHAIMKEALKRDPTTEIMVAGYDRSYEYFRTKFPTIKIHGYKLPGTALHLKLVPFALSNLFLLGKWFGSTLQVKQQLHGFTPDLVVSDFEPIGPMLARLFKRPCLIVFGYDPLSFKEWSPKDPTLRLEAAFFEKVYSMADQVVIPSFFPRKATSAPYRYVPPIVRTLPSDLPSAVSLRKKLRLQRPPVLVVLGGSAFGYQLARRLHAMAPEIPEDFLLFSRDLTLPPLRNFRTLPFRENFFEYLKASKAVLTLGGHLTLSECLVYRKPMMIFPIRGHVEQMLNARSLRHLAAVQYGTANLKNALLHFLHNIPVYQAQMPRVKGTGAKDVVEVMTRLSSSS